MDNKYKNVLYLAGAIIAPFYPIALLVGHIELFFAITFFVVFYTVINMLMISDEKNQERQRIKAEEKNLKLEEKRLEFNAFIDQYEIEKNAFVEKIQKLFPIPSCPRCGNLDFIITEFNPHFTGVKLCCNHCEKVFWVKNTSSIRNDLEKAYTTILDKYTEICNKEYYIFGSSDVSNSIYISTSILGKKNKNQKTRTAIPKNIKMEVWQRDGGKCIQCGSNEGLEYDHIIPFSKGGANTTRNLQLLCESCNRSKGAKIE
jgi:transposase-like protein